MTALPLADAEATPLEQAETHHACANCATPLVGHYCHECGQRAHLHDRLTHLFHELLESVAHFDGRLWRTLPLLAFRPGELSRRWLAGKRVAYIAPLHVFMFAIFLVFLIPNFTGHHLITMNPNDLATIHVGAPAASADGDEALPKPVQRFLDGLHTKSKDAKYYGYKIETLAYKLAFLMAPLAMVILALVTWRPSRRSTAYKHAVVALYGLAAAALSIALVMILPSPVGDWLAILLLFALPIHAIVHLRGAYGCSWPGAVLRGLALCLFTVIGFALFLGGVMFLGLSS